LWIADRDGVLIWVDPHGVHENLLLGDGSRGLMVAVTSRRAISTLSLDDPAGQ
jgi:hypothetical protein